MSNGNSLMDKSGIFFIGENGRVQARQAFLASCGCFTGDTKIRYQYIRKGYKTSLGPNDISIKDLYKKFGRGFDGKLLVRGKRFNRVGLNEVVAIKHLGIKKVIQLEFDNGIIVKSTPDHLFWSEKGWTRADEMLGVVGYKDEIKARRRGPWKKFKDPRICVPSFHPYARPQTNSNKSTSYLIELHRATFEAYLNGYDDISLWRKEMHIAMQFVNPKEYVIHHIDGDHSNNAKDNLAMLTDVGHKTIHSMNSVKGLAHMEESRCIKITEAGEEHVYDIMCDTYNSYTANGMIVHNCGSINKATDKIFTLAGVRKQEFPHTRPTTNKMAKAYIQDHGFAAKFPVLHKSTYGVIIDPKTETGVDVSKYSPEVVEKFKAFYDNMKAN